MITSSESSVSGMLDSVPPPAAPAVSTACLLEGVWSEGLDFHAETEAHPPFRVTHASQGWLAFCGFRPSEVLGKSLSYRGLHLTFWVVSAHRIPDRGEERNRYRRLMKATWTFREGEHCQPTSHAVAPASFSA